MLRKVMHYGAKKKKISNAHRLQKQHLQLRGDGGKNTAQMNTRLKKDSMALANQRSLTRNKYTLPDNRPPIKRAAHLAVFLCKITAIQLHKWMQPGRCSMHYTHTRRVQSQSASDGRLKAQSMHKLTSDTTPSDAPLAETQRSAQVHSRPVQRL